MARGGPVPHQVLLGEVDERAGDVEVVRDESTIKISKAKEGAYVLDFGRGRPAGNAIELDGVHGQLPRLHDHPQVFDFISGKFALFKFQMEI